MSMQPRSLEWSWALANCLTLAARRSERPGHDGPDSRLAEAAFAHAFAHCGCRSASLVADGSAPLLAAARAVATVPCLWRPTRSAAHRDARTGAEPTTEWRWWCIWWRCVVPLRIASGLFFSLAHVLPRRCHFLTWSPLCGSPRPLLHHFSSSSRSPL